MLRVALIGTVIVAAVGCVGEVTGGASVDAGPEADAAGGTTADARVAPDAARPDAAPASCSDTGGDRLTQVCRRWTCDTMDLSEGTWNGDVATCTPGTISPDGHANVLKLVNLYRFLAELPPVASSPGFDATAQACSLMIDANNQLDHTPPTTWACYTPEGDEGAGSSNEASTPAVAAIPLYMVDPGNPTTIGHRRWILSNSLGPIGIGSTDGWSCLRVIGGSGAAGRAWTAWPPPGPFPVAALYDPFGTSVDETGWTVQSDSIDLSGAAVQVVRDGTDTLSVARADLLPYYGALSAIRFNPQGWTTQAGHRYAVTVTPTSGAPIAYTVDAVDCP